MCAASVPAASASGVTGFSRSKVMVDIPRFKIGLNESTVGIAVPPFFMDSYRSMVGHRIAGKHKWTNNK